jgi:hypothetical protein
MAGGQKMVRIRRFHIASGYREALDHRLSALVEEEEEEEESRKSDCQFGRSDDGVASAAFCLDACNSCCGSSGEGGWEFAQSVVEEEDFGFGEAAAAAAKDGGDVGCGCGDAELLEHAILWRDRNWVAAARSFQGHLRHRKR